MKMNPQYWAAYSFFISALIITIRTDLEKMLISRFVSLFLIPLVFIASYFRLIPTPILSSFLGTIGGAGILFVVSRLFYILRKKEGLGQGDIELLGFIGSFLGLLGCWMSLFIGSFIGSAIGILFFIKKRTFSSVKIPFGPFLALGALSYLFFEKTILFLLLPNLN